jgi:hypothetical protein
MKQIHKNWLWIALIIFGAYLYLSSANKFNENYLVEISQPIFKFNNLNLNIEKDYFTKLEVINAIAINENKITGFLIFIVSLLMMLIENDINLEKLKNKWKKKK